ncbi:TonB-dependent receptor [Oleiharenicola lentus]|uniref:TonB-dependent receptor n=1 Tax=Oleiharenicola lentus TaxID=2508720 RepID=UPI003F661D09
MHVFGRRLAASLLGFALLNTLASAATINGRVRDSNTNSYLLGATVTVSGLDRTTTTSTEGGFSISNVPAGTYTVTVSSLGFADFSEQVTLAENDTRTLQIAVKSDVVDLGKFVIAGSREGQARALQQKRSASNIMDAVSADAVGKLPDGNAAEALRRVPGISLETDQDEGRYVVLRGINSALNTVTLNNQLIGTPSEQGNRGIALDSVPADLIARLEVVKAVTPDMDANAVGGSINIVTQSAFDRPERFIYGSISGFYDTFSKTLTPSGSFTYGNVFGDDKKWGFVAGASYSLKNFKSQTANTRSWSLVNGLYVPLTQQNYDYEVERERLGANVALQFRPADGHELALRLNHNEFTDTEGRQSVLYEYRLGTLTNQTATSGTNSQGRASRQFRDYHQTGTIDAASLEGKHKIGGDSLLSWQAGASRGERETPTRVDWEYRSAAGAFPNTYDLSGEELVITPTGSAYYDPANYPFRRVRFRSDIEQEDVYSGQLDFKRDLQLAGRNGYWKVGAKFVSREKADDRTNQNYNLAAGAANLFTLADGGLASPEPANYFNGLFRYGPGLNLEANKAYFAANPGRFTFDAATTLADSMSGDFDASEDVAAGYAMASLDLNKTMNVLAGVRYEATEANYGANQLFNGTWRRVTGSQDYDNVLPGLHFNWRPTDKTVIRAAWTNTLSRPGYADLAPRGTFDSIETSVGSGVYTGTLSSGNPNLKPFESMNFDVSVEYYLKNSGILSAGVFHKRLKNPIYSRVILETNVTREGRLYQTLTTTEPDNADSGEITGLELNYQQFFKFLPSPFDGLGVNLNYTVIDSSVKLFTRTDELPFFKQSDRIVNAALFYEKYKWEARVAVSYSGDYLDAVGANTDTDIYVRGRAPVDFKVSYRINSQFKVFAELLNITEEPLREYTGIRSRENDYEIYESKARAGLNFTF